MFLSNNEKRAGRFANNFFTNTILITKSSKLNKEKINVAIGLPSIVLNYKYVKHLDVLNSIVSILASHLT